MKLFLIAGTATISAALGISDERKHEIISKVKDIIKVEDEKAEGDRANALVNVWNEFEGNPAECAFAMYALEPLEEGAQLHKLFSGALPEAVAEVMSH